MADPVSTYCHNITDQSWVHGFIESNVFQNVARKKESFDGITEVHLYVANVSSGKFKLRTELKGFCAVPDC